MISKVARLEVLGNNNNIADLISDLQKVMRDELTSEDFETEADEISYLKMFDAYDLVVNPVEKFYTVISFNHFDINTFTSELLVKINSLLSLLNTKELYIISHWKHNLFGSLKNNYPPLKKALSQTKAIIGSLNYNEAFKVSLEDLPSFIETLFWIERCDPSAPEYIYFADLNDRFAFHFCKHGNIHLTEFENQIINNEVLSSFNMYFVNDCWEQFSNKPGIEGRALSF